MNTFTDAFGLLRVKTKIILLKNDEHFRCPIVLPSDHRLTEMIIRDYHLRHSHAGVQVLLYMLRENFWILRSRKTVRTVIRQCVRCRRYEATNTTVQLTPLPEDRVRDARIFEVVDVDVSWAFNPEKWRKSLDFVVYRADHLETIISLSTENLQGFRRFIARRGRPKVIYSDNRTNFVGK